MSIRPWMGGGMLLLVLLAPPPAFAAERKVKLAVLDFVLHGRGHETADLGQIVAEWLITALVQQGQFDVVERRLLSRILEEQQLAQSGVVDEGTAARIGKLLGVNVIVSGSVQRLEQQTEIHFRLIDVESASILAAESVQGGTGANLDAMIGRVAQGIMRHFPLEGFVLSRDADRVMLDLGGLAGARAGQRFAVFREGATLLHPKTGEVLGGEREETGTVHIRAAGNKTSQAEILSEIAPGSIQPGQRVVSVSEVAHADRTEGLESELPAAPAMTTPVRVAPAEQKTPAGVLMVEQPPSPPAIGEAATPAAVAATSPPESERSRASGLVEEGRRLAGERLWEDALAVLTQAVDLDSRNADAWKQRGEVYQRQRKLELALSDYAEALALTPGDAQLHYRCGLLHARLSDFDRAIAAYDRALELDDHLAHAWNNRGLAKARLQEYDQAISDYNRALALDDTLIHAWNNRGVAFRHKGDMARAIADFDRAIALDPKYAVALGNRGAAYHGLQKLAEALADFDRALALDPELDNVREGRDCVWRELGLEPGTDRSGMDLRTIDLPVADPFACARACREDPACRAFTYQPPGSHPQAAARCHLKSGEPAAVPDPAAVSGVVSR